MQEGKVKFYNETKGFGFIKPNDGSLERLRILSSPTCVSLWYGYAYRHREDFLGSVESIKHISY